MNRRARLAGAGAALVAAARDGRRSRKAKRWPRSPPRPKPRAGVVVDGPPIDAVREAIVTGLSARLRHPGLVHQQRNVGQRRARARRTRGRQVSARRAHQRPRHADGHVSAQRLAGQDRTGADRARRRRQAQVEGRAPLVRRSAATRSCASSRTSYPELAINTKLVKRGEMTTWKSLLDPKWQGKADRARIRPVRAPAASLTSYFYIKFGADFVKKLYVDQKPVLSRDARQAVQWLADRARTRSWSARTRPRSCSSSSSAIRSSRCSRPTGRACSPAVGGSSA